MRALASRIGASLPAIVIGLVMVVALWLLPDLTPADAMPVVGQQTDRGRIVESLGTNGAGIPAFGVELSDGTIVEAVVLDASDALPGLSSRKPYDIGDEVVVTRFSGPAAGNAPPVISEPWRVPLLGLAAALFAAAVLVIGGLRGARSLVALALTLTVVVRVVIPLLLHGVDPVLLAVTAAAAITLVTLLMTEGFSRITLAASVGTFAALAMTAALAALFTAAAEFTAIQGNESIAFLIPIVGEGIDLTGILLAATVFGTLGVLDDVTVTQAAAVEQLARAEPSATRGRVVGRAMRIGRSHIAATVNTLVLAYLGASLPLLLLFALSGQAPLVVLNGEIVAVEVIRALVGSIGIVAAVPLTTLVAAALLVSATAGRAPPTDERPAPPERDPSEIEVGRV
jgi:uncharacterized membrane protein